jgi:hypothetical protein
VQAALFAGVTYAAVTDVRYGVDRGDGQTGTCHVPTAAQTLYGISVDVSDTGTQHVPSANDVRSGTATGTTTGNATFPAVGKVQNDTSYGTSGTQYTGTLDLSAYTLISGVAAAQYVLSGHDNYVGGSAGTYVAPVAAGYSALAPGFGAAGGTSGTLAASKIHDATYGTLADGSVLVAAGGSYVDPADSAVWHGVAVGVSPRAGTKVGSSIANLSAGNVRNGITIDDVTGTYTGSGGGGIDPGDIVAAEYVVTGHDNYVGGSAGTYVAPVAAGYSALAPGFGAAGGTSGTLAASKIHDATYGTLADGSVLVAAGGSYVDPANSAVWHGVAVGVSPRVGTKVGSSIANLSASNVKDGVTIDNVLGTYTGSGGGGGGYTPIGFAPGIAWTLSMDVLADPAAPAIAVDEVVNCAVSWANLLGPDEVLAGSPAVVDEGTETDLTIDEVAINSETLRINGRPVGPGKALCFRLSGQSAEKSPYTLQLSITTNATPTPTRIRSIQFTAEAA